MPLNKDKLAKLQAANEQVRTGGKGTARRKKKVVHKTTTDTKKLQSQLKRLGVNAIPGIEEVNMMKDDGNVIHFSAPKVQASLHANTFAIAGQNEEKPLTDMLPSILNQLMGPDADKLSHFQEFMQSKKTAEEGTKGETGDDDDVPELVENFEEASKDEV